MKLWNKISRTESSALVRGTAYFWIPCYKILIYDVVRTLYPDKGDQDDVCKPSEMKNNNSECSAYRRGNFQDDIIRSL